MTNSNVLRGSSDAARLAEVAEGTLRDYAKRGIVDPIVDSQGRRLYSVSDIEKAKAHRAKRK